MATSNTMSKIRFSLEALANSVTTRAEKGVLVLVLDDKNVQGIKTYTQLKKVTDNWESANKAYITTAFSDYGVAEVKVVSAHTGGDSTIAGKDNIGNSLSDALALLNKVFVNGWLVAPQVTTTTANKIISSFVKSQRQDTDYPLKAVLCNYASDHEGVVNFTGTGLKYTTTTTTSVGSSTVGGSTVGNTTTISVSSEDYLVDVASYLCTLSANEAITNHIAKNVTDCDVIDDMDTHVANGELFLYNNGTNIVFSRGVNSKVTFSSTESEALSKIRVIEVIDMVKSDLRTTFNETYIGKYGNSYSNRKSLVSKLNGTYFKTITTEGYLSNDDTSYCELDVDATKSYLESQGTDTDKMTDLEVLKSKLGSHVFIKIFLYVMDVVEDIDFKIMYTT